MKIKLIVFITKNDFFVLSFELPGKCVRFFRNIYEHGSLFAIISPQINYLTRFEAKTFFEFLFNTYQRTAISRLPWAFIIQSFQLFLSDSLVNSIRFNSDRRQQQRHFLDFGQNLDQCTHSLLNRIVCSKHAWLSRYTALAFLGLFRSSVRHCAIQPNVGKKYISSDYFYPVVFVEHRQLIINYDFNYFSVDARNRQS